MRRWGEGGGGGGQRKESEKETGGPILKLYCGVTSM